MQNLSRLFLPKFSEDAIQDLVAPLLAAILGQTAPSGVLLFGSAARGDFDACSDLDFVLIYPSMEIAREARHRLYQQRPACAHAVDFLCVDEATFLQRSQLGGVYFNAALEGKWLYTREGCDLGAVPI
jgi:predicted nucleotidyltransferase